MKRISAAAFALFLLSGCSTPGGSASVGLNHADSENAYTIAAIATDVAIRTGKLNADAIGVACLSDFAAYSILTSTRNVADGSNYVPADNAHATLQKDGSGSAPVQCGGVR